MKTRFGFLLAFLFLLTTFALAQTTAFTYQGKLTDNGTLASGQYDLQVKLFDALTEGTQQGATLTLSNVAVVNGVFTVSLDFGACASCFNGAARYLDISVRVTSGGAFTPLAPRQPVTSNPYAIKSLNATSADGLSVACVNCVTSSQIASVSGSAVTGPIPVGSVPAGSASYVQNGTAQQAGSNFNVSGDGTAGGTLTGSIVNAVNQVNINGLRSFTVNGAFNDGAGTVFTATNTFAGDGAGVNTTPSGTLNNVIGKFNSFVGAGAGQANTTGYQNAFFGTGAGRANTTGFNNAFFGTRAGFSNATGSDNAFFGTYAGLLNTTGLDNAFFGFQAGFNNTTGGINAFFGSAAGFNDTAGFGNVFIGEGADFNATNTTGGNNTLLGAATQVVSGLINATAIGAFAQVTQSNSLVLGSISGINDCNPFVGCDSVNVGIGTTAPAFKLQVIDPSNTGLRVQTDAMGGTVASFGRFGNFLIDSAAGGGGRLTVLENGNVGVGATSPSFKLHVIDPSNTGLRVQSNTAGGTVASFGGVGAFQIDSNGVAGGRFMVLENGKVGIGTILPDQLLTVNGNASKPGGGSWAIFSDERLKNIRSRYTRGLQAVMQLQPIRYEYKPDNALGLRGIGEYIGFSAQEVQRVLPEAVSRSTSGYLQINNDPILWTMLNAVKEQQAQITSQQAQLTQQTEQMQNQQREIDDLKRLICLQQPKAKICKAERQTGFMNNQKRSMKHSS